MKKTKFRTFLQMSTQPSNKRFILLTLLALLIILPSQMYAQGGQNGVTSLIWSPDGGQLAAGTEDGTVSVWQAETWEMLATLTEHQGSVTSMAWSPQSDRLASGSADGMVLVWDADTWDTLATLQGEGTGAPLASNSRAASVAACQLRGRSGTDVFDYQQLGIPRPTGFTPSTGMVEVAVLFADYSDAQASTDPEAEFALLYPDETADFFAKASYGRMTLDFEAYPTWLTLPETASYYNELMNNKTSDADEVDFIEEVVALTASDVDVSTADVIVVITNQDARDGIEFTYIASSANAADAIQVDGSAIPTGFIIGNDLRYNDYEATRVENRFTRALGFSMSLMRHGYQNGDIFSGLTDLEREGATGSFSQMGNLTADAKAPGLFAFERWQLGWLDDGQIVCQTEGEQTTDLAAIGQRTGTKAVMVPLDSQSALVVESRRATGLDADLEKEGALVYVVDTSVERNGAPIRVLPALNNDPYRDQSPLAEGESLTVCNIEITNIEAGTTGDTVEVIVPDTVQCSVEDAMDAQVSATDQASAPAPTRTPKPAVTSTPAPTSAPTQSAVVTTCPKIDGALQVICYDIEGATKDEMLASRAQNSPASDLLARLMSLPGSGMVMDKATVF